MKFFIKNIFLILKLYNKIFFYKKIKLNIYIENKNKDNKIKEIKLPKKLN